MRLTWPSAWHEKGLWGDCVSDKGIGIRRYTVDICDPCAKLDGSECHTAGCIFFLCDMQEVREFMNRALIAPVIDGERFIVQKGRLVCHER